MCFKCFEFRLLLWLLLMFLGFHSVAFELKPLFMCLLAKLINDCEGAVIDHIWSDGFITFMILNYIRYSVLFLS